MSVNLTGETPGVGVPRALAVDMTIADQQDWLAAFLRRHPVSRRTALRGGAGVLATLAASGSPWARGVAAAAAPAPVTVVGRHLAYGPDPARSMSFSGELTAAPPPGRMVVDVGTDSGFGLTLPVQVRPLESLVPQVDGSIRGTRQWFAHARADGLAPGSRYVYRFRIEGSGGTTTTTATSTFRTAAPRGTRHRFTFTAFADQGVSTGGEPNHYKPDDSHRSPAPAEALTALVAAEAPAFHLLAGDICYADPSGAGRPVRNGARQDDEAHDSFDPTVWSTYFAAIERSAASTPWMFATGNHDMEALYDLNRADGPAHGYAGHAARLALPGTGPRGCPSVYAFTHGTVGVVSVDANDLSTEIPTNAGYSGGTQLTWLERTLAGPDDQKQAETVTWSPATSATPTCAARWSSVPAAPTPVSSCTRSPTSARRSTWSGSAVARAAEPDTPDDFRPRPGALGHPDSPCNGPGRTLHLPQGSIPTAVVSSARCRRERGSRADPAPPATPGSRRNGLPWRERPRAV
ncbi:hypothetical protein [Pseudonocardia alni]|uniref:hypothetical protein n=1 Tax=Pseudonocardia alni TaxID=33907 RepID=UPI0033D02033